MAGDMRNQLKQFEGQNVVIEGRMTKLIRQPGGLIDICLAVIKVRPVKSDVPLKEEPAIKVDHAWLQGIEEKHLENGGLLQKYCGAARVSYYTRKNGTIDLGFQSIASVNLEQVIIDGEKLDTSGRASLLRHRLKQIDDGWVTWGYHYAADETIVSMRRLLKKYDRSLTRSFGTMFTAPANGPCQSLDLLPKVKRGRKAAAGFA